MKIYDREPNDPLHEMSVLGIKLIDLGSHNLKIFASTVKQPKQIGTLIGQFVHSFEEPLPLGGVLPKGLLTAKSLG